MDTTIACGGIATVFQLPNVTGNLYNLLNLERDYC